MELNLNPAYVWTAAGLAPGAPGDCSGKLYAIFASCGIPVQRVPARYIAKQLGGWSFPIVMYSEGKILALVIMTPQKFRPNGHIGILRSDVKYGKIARMAHATKSLGFHETILKPGDYWYEVVDFLMQIKP